MKSIKSQHKSDLEIWFIDLL